MSHSYQSHSATTKNLLVNAELIKLEQDIEMALDKHNAFLKELDLPPLP